MLLQTRFDPGQRVKSKEFGEVVISEVCAGANRKGQGVVVYWIEGPLMESAHVTVHEGDLRPLELEPLWIDVTDALPLLCHVGKNESGINIRWSRDCEIVIHESKFAGFLAYQPDRKQIYWVIEGKAPIGLDKTTHWR